MCITGDDHQRYRNHIKQDVREDAISLAENDNLLTLDTITERLEKESIGKRLRNPVQKMGIESKRGKQAERQNDNPAD
jgi:hypothetical protein